MKGSELKKIAESLGRFASVREKAPFPQDRLIIQAANGVVKVVAAAPYGTLIATVHESSEKFRAVIRSRDFILQAKALSAKQEVHITQAREGWENGIEMGGAYFESITRDLPANIHLPSEQEQDGGYIDFTADEIEELARIVGAASDKWYPHVQVAGAIVTHDSSHIRIAVTDNYRWATREYRGNYEIFGTLEREFVESLRGIGDCRFKFDPATGKVDVSGGRWRAIGNYNFLSYRVPTERPAIAEAKPDNLAIVDRTKLLKSLRENEKFDKSSRVWLQYADGTVNVVPYGKTSHGWSVNGRYLIDLLMATSVKKIGLGLRTGRNSAISMRIPDWTIEIAPIAGESQTKKSTPTLPTIPQGIYGG